MIDQLLSRAMSQRAELVSSRSQYDSQGHVHEQVFTLCRPPNVKDCFFEEVRGSRVHYEELNVRRVPKLGQGQEVADGSVRCRTSPHHSDQMALSKACMIQALRSLPQLFT